MGRELQAVGRTSVTRTERLTTFREFASERNFTIEINATYGTATSSTDKQRVWLSVAIGIILRIWLFIRKQPIPLLAQN